MNIKVVLLLLLSPLMISASCINTVCTVDKDSLKWFMIGDWGGIPLWPWYSYAQNKVAQTMGKLAEQESSDFQLSLGDNFYILGVENEKDPRFQNSFESVYTASSLDKPWYVVAGNHDHYGNVTGQVEYSKRSQRWTFPSLWYSFGYQLSDSSSTSIDFVMIDTVTLCGNTRDIHSGTMLQYVGLESHDPIGPENLQKAEGQWSWLEEKLKSSRASYLFVAGHFPVYSVAEHGPTACLVDRLLPLLSKYKVSAYFSGHDHNLQHLKTTTNGWTTDLIVSGAGGFISTSQSHKDSVPADSLQYVYPESGWSPFGLVGFTNGGYAFVHLDKSKAEFKFFKGNQYDNPLYQFEVKPRSI